MRQLRIVIFGRWVTSSWGNGHATPYRSLMRALSMRGHDVLFLERDAPGYAAHRDFQHPPFGRARVYASLREDIPEKERVAIGDCARARVMSAHTATHRDAELEGYIAEALGEPDLSPAVAAGPTFTIDSRAAVPQSLPSFAPRR